MDLKELMEKLNKEWAEFRSENDRRLKEVETKGRADPLTEAKVDKHSEAIGLLEKSINEITAKLNRPGAGAGEGDATREVKEHRKLFGNFLRKGEMTPRMVELQEKLLQVGVDSDGGMAIPQELDTAIGKMEIDATPMLQLVTSMSAGGETYEKLFDLRGTGSGWVGELETRAETNTPKFGSFQPRYGELYALPFASQKMLDDSKFNVEQWLAESVVEKFASDIDVAIVSGNGVNKPRGLLSMTLAATADSSRDYGTVEKLHSGTSGGFDTDDLLDLMIKLKPGYRASAVWLMAGATLNYIRKLKDSADAYLWQPSIQAGVPSLLLGHSVAEDENMPAIGAASNSIIFGDLRRAYKFVNIQGVRTLRDPFTAKPKVGFYTTKRVGGGVEDTSAYKVLSLQA